MDNKQLTDYVKGSVSENDFFFFYSKSLFVCLFVLFWVTAAIFRLSKRLLINVKRSVTDSDCVKGSVKSSD